MGPVLRAEITVDYPGKLAAVDGVRLEIASGEIFGLAGESGSGKSTIALALLGLIGLRGGRMRGSIVFQESMFQNRDLANLEERELRELRGRSLSLVPQSPIAALNPALRIGTQLAEAFRAHSQCPRNWRNIVGPLLDRVALPSDDGFLRRYPREISVGQAQRVLIAMAIMHGPALLIADEPTSALDPISAAASLRLFRELNAELGMAVLFISHDLASLGSLCGRMAVLRAGRLVEEGTVSRVLFAATDPYARQLAASIPQIPLKTQGGETLHLPRRISILKGRSSPYREVFRTSRSFLQERRLRSLGRRAPSPENRKPS